MDQTSRWYDLQFLRYRVWQTEIGNYGWFLPFYPHPPKHPKNQNFEKIKKKLLEVSSFYKCEPKTSHVRYGSWETESDRQNFCHFGPFVALLPHYWPQTLKFGKNVKKTWRYYPFTHVYHKWRSYHVWYGSWDIKAWGGVFFVILGHLLPPLTLLTTGKIKILKK